MKVRFAPLEAIRTAFVGCAICGKPCASCGKPFAYCGKVRAVRKQRSAAWLAAIHVEKAPSDPTPSDVIPWGDMRALFALAAVVLVFILGYFSTQWHGSVTVLERESAAAVTPTPAQSPEDFPEPSETPENTSLADKSPQYLCDHLSELKHTAYKTEFSGDAIYDALKRKGNDAIPCLVDKITDTQPAKNPTGAPFWAGLTYRVGDTAVLMLMDINEMWWPKGMLSTKYERMFKEEGMFSYYFYVHDVPGARRQVQRWWRKWMKTCKPECQIVPTLEK